MMEQDLKHNKCLNVFAKKTDAEAMRKILLKHYLSIKNLFYCIASTSNFPAISLDDFNSFLFQTGILKKNMVGAPVQINFFGSEPKNLQIIHRPDFISLLIKLASLKYRDFKMISELPEAVGKLLKQCIVPYYKKVERGVIWRYKYMYNVECSNSFDLGY